ncbi:hypothetical protein BDZ94DRAFT_1317400 [Collybia nuda]|uniref:Uncharacterized protein n=1 Tax=Collybia nuda TaxID=64659 RepID=A0A9P5YF37_9AGAR|nr:hypothetical protein BDZ94DRAFT_1317400 [Collybia nuda]
MFSSMKVFTTLSLLTFAAANPTLLPRTCKPNFQGRPLTIYKQPEITDIGVYEWTPVNAVGGHISLVQEFDSFKKDEFIVEFTGTPTNTYQIKMVADTAHKLALTAGANGDLAFSVATSEVSASQEFAISCDVCATDEGRGENCVISHPASNTCVSGSKPGQTLVLAACDGSENQTYNLWEGI